MTRTRLSRQLQASFVALALAGPWLIGCGARAGVRSPAMHAANAPTPGTTSPSALSAASGSAVTTVSAPARTKAFSAERMFPEP